jgi:hypothetical protein
LQSGTSICPYGSDETGSVMTTLDTFRALHEHDHQLAAYCATSAVASTPGLKGERCARKSAALVVDAFCHKPPGQAVRTKKGGATS